MTLLILTLLFIRTTPHLTPLELSLETPTWAHQWQQLQRLYVFTATPQGIFMSTALTTNVPIADNSPQATLSISAFVTTVLFANTSVTPPTLVQTSNAPSVMTLDTSLWTVPSLRTPAVVSSSTMGTQRDSSHVLVVQVFEGGIVTIHGDNVLFFPLSIFHHCLLIRLTPSPFQLCSSQMIIEMLYGNLPFVLDILDADTSLLR